MDPIKHLADEIYRDRVRRARRMTMAEKILDGPQLFDMACRISRCGIRSQFPDADEQQVEELLRQRLAIARRLEAVQ
jgi:hypothetical protein